MSKKDFKGGLSTILGETPVEKIEVPNFANLPAPGTRRKRGRPKTNFREITKSSQEGTIYGEVRATFIVSEEILEKLKAIAYWDRLLIKEVINKSLGEFIERYEAEKGEIKAIPNQ